VEPSTTRTEGSVTGTVVGANCWLSRGLEGDKYRDTALICAQNGTPLTIVTDDGSPVYPFTVGTDGSSKPDMERLLPYAEQRVKATGLVVGRGMERGIIIDNVTAVQEPKRPRMFGTKETPNATVEGRVVNLTCWLEKGNAGTADSTCVGLCAGGDPLVIVTGGGRIYYPVTRTTPTSPVGTAMLSDYCARKVRVTGTVIARGEGRAIIIDRVVASASK